MPAPASKRLVGRGERTLPGVWRLRLPVEEPGVPHVNAWAVAAGDGIVLFDCGLYEPGSAKHLERALDMVNLRLEHVRLLVCTHAHHDHYGQAATVVDAAGCELWMHPRHEHTTAVMDDPAAALERRLEVGRLGGVPAKTLQAFKEARQDKPLGVKRLVLPDRELVDGVEVDTDLGRWIAYETPGHCPSHVCLFCPDQRLLISGDHVIGRVSPYFDLGYSKDPVGEFLASLDRVDALDARLCLPGHGRTFNDVRAHVVANRDYIADRMAAITAAIAEHGPITAYDILPRAYDVESALRHPAWLLTEVFAILRHLEATGVVAADGSEPRGWATV